MIRTLLASLTVALLTAAVAHGLTSERYTLTVGNQGAGGDPGVLYVGGPANFRVVDRGGGERPLELCVEPAPIDQPSCRRSTTNRTISGPAFTAAGETVVRFTVDGRPPVERAVVVRSPEAAQAEGGPVRILGAAAIAEGRGAAVVVRLNRALPTRGQARPPLMLGREIVRNEVLPRGQRFFGGTTPNRVGRRGRHCYAAEAQQVVPRSALRPGTTFVAAIRRDRRVVAARPVTIRRGSDGFDPAFLRRAGC